MNYIRFFEEIGATDVALVGGKGANLGETAVAGLPVPPGFCLTARAYQHFVEDAGLQPAIRGILEQMDPADPGDVRTKAAEIRTLITEQQVPGIMAQEIGAAYAQLAERLQPLGNGHLPVAVRSSATAEDLPTASFAGQQETYLNVRGEQDLIDRVKDCWASLWTDRAVTYRQRQGFDHSQVYLAVVIQAMVDSEVAGILFTANPVTGSRSEMVINASWGLGEAVVSGLVTPDTLTVRKADGSILNREIASKEQMIAYSTQVGTVELPVPEPKRTEPALSEQQVIALTELGRQVEDHYQSPQDIEWALAGNAFYLLQSRPITTLGTMAELASVEHEYSRTMFVEILPEAITPIFASVLQPLFSSMLDFTFETLGYRPPQGMEAVGMFYNQPYFNRDYIVAALEPLSPAVRERLAAQIVSPFGRHEQGLQGELSLPYLRMTYAMLRFLTGFPKQLPGLLEKYRGAVARVAAKPPESMTDAEIVGSIRDLVLQDASELLDYDFLMIALIGITYQMLGTLMERTFGEDTEELRSKLISGVTGNVTMETNKRLWELAQVAKASSAVTEIMRNHEPQEVLQVLQESSEATLFLAELERFLAEYGHREVHMDILYPTWSEDPAPLFGFIRGYLDADEAQSPHRQQARLVKERTELTEEVRTEMRGSLRGRILLVPLFDWVLKHTQAHTRERDTVHFELTRMFPPFRRMLQELGKRWAEQGLIEDPEDTYFLGLDELADIARSPRPVKDLVREHRAAFQTNRTRPWPDIIRQGEEVYEDQGLVSDEDLLAGQLRGVAGSPHVASGTARIIRGPEEFGQLKRGDILVAPYTNPAWTPLFAVASGIVTEVGGILSHGAIVAREYGIPAVMGVRGVTQAIQEGQTIVVDGNRGIVHLQLDGVGW